MAKKRRIGSDPLKPARELASVLVKLPREDRLRLEGAIIGIEMSHRDKLQPKNPKTSKDSA